MAPGQGIHTRRLLDALLGAGHRVTLLSRDNPFNGSAPGYQFLPYPNIPGFHRLSLHLTARLEPPVRAAQMRAIWRRVRPDIVNVQGIDWRVAYCTAARLRPLAVTAWGADINDLFDTDFSNSGFHERLTTLLGAGYYITSHKELALARYKRRIGAALRRVNLLTAVTPQILRRCEELAGRKLPKQIFRYGVDLDLFRPGYEKEALEWRRELRIPDGVKVLLSVRTLQPLFGHHHILEAFAEVAHDPKMPRAVLVFQEKYTFASELESLKRRVGEMNLQDRVFWLPGDIPQERLPVQYALADVVINYPMQDGFPVSMLEAAACRCPIVTSDLEAYEGTYGDAVVRVPRADAPALAGALKRVLTEDRASAQARVMRAYEVAARIGDQKKNFAELFAAFESLCRNQR